MGLLGFLKKRAAKPRVMIVGLDGVPYSFLAKQIAAGKMPNLAKLAGKGSLVQADSIHPCVSCVAWTSYSTGRNPGKHGIFGFQDRKPGTYDTYIATGAHMKAETMWETLSRRGKRVIALNIPGSYPPKPVNGLMVGDFLSPRLEGATYPADLASRLEVMGYRIDIDPAKGRQEDRGPLLEDLHETLAARKRTMFALMKEEEWDVMQVHFMGTDRIAHFLIEQWEQGDPRYAPEFERYFAAIDNMLGELDAELDDRTALLSLSDHGFCSIKREVFVNRWLQENGFLEELAGERPKLDQLTTASRAYSMDPGRIYVNLKGREPNGSVEAGAEYEASLAELTEALLAMTCPETGERVVSQVLRRDELFQGPHAAQGPDLVAYPFDGYDLKGQLGRPEVFFKGSLVGMHTFDDAFWYVRGREFSGRPKVMDGAPTVLALLGEEPEPDMDGEPRVE